MAKYKLQRNDSVHRTTDGAVIPDDPGNRDRIEYNEWLAAGNTPDPWVETGVDTPDQIYDSESQSQKLLKAVVMCLNDGTLPIAMNLTNAQLKNIIKAKL